MQQILARLYATVVLADEKIAQAEALINEYNQKLAELRQDKEELIARTSELDARESKVKVIEDVVKIKEDTVVLAEKAKRDLKEILIKINAFDAYQSQMMGEFSLTKQNLDARKRKVEADEAEIIKSRMQLEKDKRDMKTKVVEEIVEKM